MATDFPKYEVIVGRAFPEKVIPLIDEAKKSIEIIVFDWRWYPQDIGSPVQLFNQSLVRAVRRGVIVRTLTNTEEIIKTLNEVNVKAKKLYSKKLLHIKMMIIDDETIIIGSHNYTQNAFQMNYELSVILEKVGADNEFKKFFNQIYG